MGTSKLFLLGIFAIILSSGCESDDIVRSSGRIITEQRTVENFNAVKISNAFDVIIVQGDVQSVSVIASDNIVPRVITQVVDQTLRIGLSGSNNIREQHRVEITVPELNRIEFNDATSGFISGSLNSQTLTIKLSGSSKFEIDDLIAGELEVRLSDASELFIKGNTSEVNARLSNASEFRVFGLTSATASVQLFDASDMDITCTESLSGSVGGSSVLRYRGNPEIEVATSSAGKIINKN